MTSAATATWTPDVLGEPFQARTIAVGDGDVATVVRRLTDSGSSKAVLYLHGFADYFFQVHVANYWLSRGYDFYAVDLRAYGRSMRPGQTPNYIDDLDAYNDELDEAVRIIRDEDEHSHVVLTAHSMGGLVASLWADRRSGGVDGLVLNSPWFDLHASRFKQTVVTRLVDRLGTVTPMLKVGALEPHYGYCIHQSMGGEWDYNLEWKPFPAFPVLAGWIRAVRRGHARLAAGLSINVPILVCASTATGAGTLEAAMRRDSDVVLDVRHMVERAPLLGSQVTVSQIAGGIHDLALSPEPARSAYFAAIDRWLPST